MIFWNFRRVIKWRCTIFSFILVVITLVAYQCLSRKSCCIVPLHSAYRKSLENVTSYEDPTLLTYIREVHLTPPAGKGVPYNFSQTYKQYKEHDEFHAKLLKILNRLKIKDGFFVEAGALDGQYLSHTLDLETVGWQGLLVEASPSLVRELKWKQRKAWIADVCLTEKVYTSVDFITRKNQTRNWQRGNGKLNPLNSSLASRSFEGIEDYKSEGNVECFALPSILKSVNVKKVDLLVLDIEGGEFRLLKQYPFKDFPIKVIAVEYWLTKEPSWMLVKHMKAQGYLLVYQGVSDMIFVHKPTSAN